MLGCEIFDRLGYGNELRQLMGNQAAWTPPEQSRERRRGILAATSARHHASPWAGMGIGGSLLQLIATLSTAAAERAAALTVTSARIEDMSLALNRSDAACRKLDAARLATEAELTELVAERARLLQRLESERLAVDKVRADAASRQDAAAAAYENLLAKYQHQRELLSRLPMRLAARLLGEREDQPLHEFRVGAPRTIVVDLTPVLPGGENGGAKVFVLELLALLARRAPQTQFVLLTQAVAHDDLAGLDAANVRRLMVVGPAVTDNLRPRLQALAARVLPFLPTPLRRLAGNVGYRLNGLLKRGRSRSFLRDLGADLLFCPFTAPTYFEPGVPTVCTIYDLQYKTYPEFFAGEDAAHRDHTFQEACRKASALTAISDYSRDSAVSHGGLDPARIQTIYLRMAQRVADGGSATGAVLARLGLQEHGYLLYPANFWRHKNHEMLLTAFGMACTAGLPQHIRLVCTGAPGARQTWLQSAAAAMGLGDRVLFPGYLSHEELSSLFSACVGVVFPSLYEGFGLPVIEAMAAGVPVACSDATSLPEVAADAAILFDPRLPDQIAAAMVTLVTDEALRQRLIRLGRDRAALFSDSGRMAAEYWDLFLYALANERHENLLTGIHADGWVGPNIALQVAPAAEEQIVEFEFMAPEWLPQARLEVTATGDGRPDQRHLEVKRGAVERWRVALGRAGGHCLIHLGPTFVPRQSGFGDDQRELSLMLRSCRIRRAEGGTDVLYPKAGDN